MIGRMKTLLVLVSLGVLTTVFTGCSGSESNDAGGVAPEAPVIDRASQYADDVARFEHASGSDLNLTPEQMHEIMKQMQEEPSFKNKFLGVPTIQNPTDAWIVMEIMYEMKPDLIVETGTFKGGSAAFWAIILEHINPDGRVITIDIEDQRGRRATGLPISKQKVDFLLGSSTDPAVVAEVYRRAKGKQVLVILDSLHSTQHVAAELKAYAPIVSLGGYMIVQDTGLGPLPAIDAFLAQTDTFVADRSRERYPDTNTVRGYLKRVGP
jgi:cephalosporin hydroxylase